MIHHYLTESEIINLNQLHTVETCEKCVNLDKNKLYVVNKRNAIVILPKCKIYEGMENYIRCIDYTKKSD